MEKGVSMNSVGEGDVQSIAATSNVDANIPLAVINNSPNSDTNSTIAATTNTMVITGDGSGNDVKKREDDEESALTNMEQDEREQDGVVSNLNLSEYCISSDADTEKMESDIMHEEEDIHPRLAELLKQTGEDKIGDAKKDESGIVDMGQVVDNDEINNNGSILKKHELEDANDSENIKKMKFDESSAVGHNSVNDMASGNSNSNNNNDNSNQDVVKEDIVKPDVQKAGAYEDDVNEGDNEEEDEEDDDDELEEEEEEGQDESKSEVWKRVGDNKPEEITTTNSENATTSAVEWLEKEPMETADKGDVAMEDTIEGKDDIKEEVVKEEGDGHEHEDVEGEGEGEGEDEDEEEEDEEDEDDVEEGEKEEIEDLDKKDITENDTNITPSPMEHESKRIEALNDIISIEYKFAELRQKLYENKLIRLEIELQMCLEGSHPELHGYYGKIATIRDYKLKRAYQRQKYELKCIDRETRATRTMIHQDFYKKVNDLKRELLTETTQKWYDINKERRNMDTVIPDISYHVPIKIANKTLSCITGYAGPAQQRLEGEPLTEDLECENVKFQYRSNPVDKLEVIVDRMRLNNELSDLQGLRKYYDAFPGAPQLNGLRDSEITEDFEQLQGQQHALYQETYHQQLQLQQQMQAQQQSQQHYQ